MNKLNTMTPQDPCKVHAIKTANHKDMNVDISL